jgi:hypothetical protein
MSCFNKLNALISMLGVNNVTVFRKCGKKKLKHIGSIAVVMMLESKYKFILEEQR